MAEKTLYLDGDNKQLRDAIFKATPLAVTQTKSIANKFKGKTDLETCQNIFNYLLTSVTYKEDGMHQMIKVPSALMREKQADCKSYALFTAGILQNLGIGWKYCLTSYNNDPTPQHIYVVTDSGIIIDAVWKIFNNEKKPNYKFYHKPDLTDMKISYIAGIGARGSNYQKRNIGNSPLTNYPTSNIGSTTLLGAMNCRSTQINSNTTLVGMGRTGNEWLQAATGQEASISQKAAYFTKSPLLSPARLLIEQFIKNNGGGLANFLYNRWLRTEIFYLPNEKKYRDAEKEALAKHTEKYKNAATVWKTPADALKRYQDAYAVFAASNPNGVFTKKQVDFYTSSQLTAYNEWKTAQTANLAPANVALKQLYADLNAKYPIASRMIVPADASSKNKYRDFELQWYWDLGGNPDDLNNAVKEGNTKSPRGKDANYLVNKMFKGGVVAGDIGLIIRAFVSAFAGDKFGLGDDGTFVISGTRNKKQGIGEPITAASVSLAVTTYLPTILVCLSAAGAVLKGAQEAGLIEDPAKKENKSEYDLSLEDGWLETKPTDVESDSKIVAKADGTKITVYREKGKEDGLSDDNTTTYIVAGVAALGLLYFISKK